jgi:hypothetical protein
MVELVFVFCPLCISPNRQKCPEQFCADAGVAGDAKTAAISVCQKRFAELLPMGRG